jgi:hypothetical protein
MIQNLLTLPIIYDPIIDKGEKIIKFYTREPSNCIIVFEPNFQNISMNFYEENTPEIFINEQELYH